MSQFVSFTQTGRRIGFRCDGITEVREAEPDDDDQRVTLIYDDKPVRVEDAYDTIIDRLNS